MTISTGTRKHTLKKSFRTYQVLDVSTGHISKKDDDLLSRTTLLGDESCPVSFFQTGYGIMVHVPDTLDEPRGPFLKSLKTYGFSTQFVKIIQFSQERACSYVNFDRDGAEYDDLKTFNW